MKRGSILTAVVLAVSCLTGVSAPSQAQTTTLRVGNWLPSHHLNIRAIVVPYLQAVEQESEGTLKFDIMSSAIGRPPEYYDFVKNGVIDIGYAVLGYNPGRFTMTQVMDLPFMAPDPWAGAAASWLTFQKYGDLYKEHPGIKMLGLWVHSEPYLNMRGEPIRNLEDLKGKKIRVGGNVTGRIVTALGGTPIQLPPTEAQQAMQSGVADGIAFPLESVEFFKITPVIKNVTRIPGGLYTDTFWIAMNEAKWNSLTPKQKAAFEKHAGLGVAMLSGWAWTDDDELGRIAMEKNNAKFFTLPNGEVQKIKQALKPLETEWLAEAKKRNLEGEAIMAYARAMADKYRAHKPLPAK